MHPAGDLRCKGEIHPEAAHRRDLAGASTWIPSLTALSRLSGAAGAADRTAAGRRARAWAARARPEPDATRAALLAADRPLHSQLRISA